MSTPGRQVARSRARPNVGSQQGVDGGAVGRSPGHRPGGITRIKKKPPTRAPRAGPNPGGVGGNNRPGAEQIRQRPPALFRAGTPPALQRRRGATFGPRAPRRPGLAALAARAAPPAPVRPPPTSPSPPADPREAPPRVGPPGWRSPTTPRPRRSRALMPGAGRARRGRRRGATG